MRQLQDRTVAEHVATLNTRENGNPDEEEGPRDFIDVYLKKIKECNDITSSFYGEDGMLNLQR